MKKIFIIILLLLATILPTFATNWVQIEEKSWIDIDTIEPFTDDNGNIIPNQYCFWRKSLNDGSQGWKNAEKLYNRKIGYALAKDVVDIKRKSFASKCFIFYASKDDVVTSNETRSLLLKWRSIVPNTVGEYLYEIVIAYVQSRR